MRKIIVQEFITLDGVMQAPGKSSEEIDPGFKYENWTAPYFREADDAAAKFMKEWMRSTDILLGRNTFDAFASFWPKHADTWPGIIDVTKYVVSKSRDKSYLDKSGWKNSVLLKNVDDIEKLKKSKGSDIKVHGSGKLAQTLFKNYLVDELLLMTFPITLGTGNRLFAEGTIAAAFELTDSLVAPNGVIFARYKRSGDVRTGTIGT